MVPPPAALIQEVVPNPSVERTWPAVPSSPGSVNTHVAVSGDGIERVKVLGVPSESLKIIE
jgi:hypothetical protein